MPSSVQIIPKSPDEHAEVMKNLQVHKNRYADSHQDYVIAAFSLYILGVILAIAISIICPIIGNKQLAKPISVEPIVSLPIVVGIFAALSFGIGLVLMHVSSCKNEEKYKMVHNRLFLEDHFDSSKGYVVYSDREQKRLVEILNQFEEPDIQKKRGLLDKGFGGRDAYSDLPKELRGLIADCYAIRL